MPDMPAARPRPGHTRTFVLLLTLPLLLLFALAVAWAWRLERRVQRLDETLTAEYQALSAARRARPSHVSRPTPGTLAQALAPVLPGFSRSVFETRVVLESECDGLLQPEHPLAEWPPRCQETLALGRDLMRQVLRASRAEEVELPEALLFSPSRHPEDSEQLGDWLHGVLELAAFDIRHQTGKGRADTAVELCLDALALSRDLGLGRGLSGAALSVDEYDRLFVPCHDALSQASLASVHRAVSGLRQLRLGMNTLPSALDEARLQDALRQLDWMRSPQKMEERVSNTWLYLEFRDTSGPGTMLARFKPLVPSLWRHALLETDRLDRQLVTLAALPPTRTAAAFERVEKLRQGAWNPLVPFTERRLQPLALRMEHQRTEVDLLLALALVRAHHAEHGRWPSNLPPLYPGLGVPPPLPLLLQAGADGTLVLLTEEEAERRREGLMSLTGHLHHVTARP